MKNEISFFFLMLHLTTTNMNVKSKVATHYYASTASNGISLKKSSICNQNVQACRENGPPKFQTYPDHHHLFVFTSQSKVSSFSLYFFLFLSLALIFLTSRQNPDEILPSNSLSFSQNRRLSDWMGNMWLEAYCDHTCRRLVVSV